MDKRKQLFRHKHPYDLRGTEQLFVEAMAQNAQFQYANCADYRRICDMQGVNVNSIRTMEDVAKLPVLPTLYFKHHELFAMPRERMLITATSSGTSGKMSKIGFDVRSLLHGLSMVLRVGRFHKLLSLVPCHYIILGYQPGKHTDTAFSKTGYGFTYMAPALSRTYALVWKDGTYELNLEGLKKQLRRSGRSLFPTRTIGFPAYTHMLLSQLKEEGVSMTLPRGSKITMGGGWKQFYAQRVEKEVLYQLAWDVLGIAEKDCVEFFGAVEHPILYTTCEKHHFHIPVYSRVIIRDPDTLAPVPHGTLGLVNLLSPMTMSMPILSVMTDDLGVIREDCGCGIDSPYLEIIGRVGVQDITTCAAGAEQLLKEV